MSLLTTKKSRKKTNSMMANYVNSFVPPTNVEELIPDSATMEEREFVIQNKDLLGVTPRDVLVHGYLNSKRIYRKIPTHVKVFFIMIVVFALVVILPLVIFTVYNLFRSKNDLIRSFILILFAFVVCIPWWLMLK
jgi:hypothetical protein